MEGVANNAKAINVRVANENYKSRNPCDVFKVEHLWNDWVKKDGVNANLIKYGSPKFKYLINFAFSSRLSYSS